jgi:hypothetical protein
MEQRGRIINGILKVTKFLLIAALYLLWGASRLCEVLLSELNKLLSRILEGKSKKQ